MAGETTIIISGSNGTFDAGGQSIAGNITLRNKDGNETIQLDGANGDIQSTTTDNLEERLGVIEDTLIQDLDEVIEYIGTEIPMDLERLNKSIQELTASVNKAQATLESHKELINSIGERLTSLDNVVTTLVTG